MPFPQVLTNKFERNLKTGAQRLDRKLGHTLKYRKGKIQRLNLYYAISSAQARSEQTQCRNVPKFSDRQILANSVDPDQTRGAV